MKETKDKVVDWEKKYRNLQEVFKKEAESTMQAFLNLQMEKRGLELQVEGLTLQVEAKNKMIGRLIDAFKQAEDEENQAVNRAMTRITQPKGSGEV